MQSALPMEEEFTLKEKILYALGSAIVLGGSFFLGRKIFLKGIAKNEEKKSLEEGAPATYAKQIKMAFENDGWPGTNVSELRKVLIQVANKEEFNKVAKSYQKLFNSSLQKDMSDELQSSEYSEMISILAAKPDKAGTNNPASYNSKEWARRLKAAFDKTYGFIPGTDEDAIRAVFSEIPTQAAFLEVANAYYALYNETLIDALKSELELWEYPEYMKIITLKPKS